MTTTRHALLLSAVMTALACGAPKAPPPPKHVGEVIPDPPAVEFPRTLEDVNPDPRIVEVNLEASVANVELEKGKPIPAWTYNGGTPGPLLNANVGDRIIVHFTNHLTEPTTIHWHGLRISDQMDGVPHIQNPVKPGETFTYDFVAPDAGSFWYHPHMRTNEQIERGLYGPIVIHEAWDKAPDFDADRYFVVDDVRLNDDGTIADADMASMDGMHGRYGNTLLLNGSTEKQTFDFHRNQVERWRIVNTANARTMYLTVDGAKWRIVGVDGGLLPAAWDKDIIELPVGARVDVEVRLNTAEPKLVAHIPYVDDNNQVQDQAFDLAVGSNLGDGPGDVDREISYPAVTLPELPATGAAKKTLVLDGYQTDNALVFTINGKAWPEMEDWTATQGTPTLITIQNNLMMIEHPFHLHGNFFQIISRDGKKVDEPGLRDTVLLAPSEKVVIATDFENAGQWMYHCHIAEHEEEGMMGMMTVAPKP